MTAKPKPELVRVVRDKENRISVDLKGKANGRGAYICRSADCLKKAVKAKRLERALECAIPPEVIAGLEEILSGAAE